MIHAWKLAAGDVIGAKGQYATQSLAIAAPDIGNQMGLREVIGGCDGTVAVIRKVGHERVEDAGLVGSVAEVIETARPPRHFVRNLAVERGVEGLPSAPGSGGRPEARAVVQAVRRVRAQQKDRGVWVTVPSLPMRKIPKAARTRIARSSCSGRTPLADASPATLETASGNILSAMPKSATSRITRDIWKPRMRRSSAKR